MPASEAEPGGRNRVAEATAEFNRSRPGAYTFNAPVDDDYEGMLFEIAALRLGEHAHLDVFSGWQAAIHEGALNPTRNYARAGRLILRWREWEHLRGILEQHEEFGLHEVENPTVGNLDRHVG